MNNSKVMLKRYWSACSSLARPGGTGSPKLRCPVSGMMIGCAVVFNAAHSGSAGNAEAAVDSISSGTPLEKRALNFILGEWMRTWSS